MMKSTEKSQYDCRLDALALMRSIVVSVEAIDAETPWSESEPIWWLEMLQIQKSAQQFITNHSKEG